MAKAKASGGSQQRARVVAEYDRLIRQFGEDPFRPSGVCQRADGFSKVMEQIDTAKPKEKHELIKEAAEKSLRCAELIEKALNAADKMKKMGSKIAEAQREFHASSNEHDEDDDEDMEGVDDTDDDTALLLGDLVAASNEMQQASKSLSQMGIVAKSTRASRDLLSTADQLLQTALDSTGGSQDGAMNDEFRDLYVDEFTSAFGDDLDQFRQEDRFESKDVTYLISCIHSGADIFTPLQKKLFVESAQTSSE